MMDISFPGVDARLAAALADAPSRIPVLLGPCGSGRTSALLRVREGLAEGAAHYIDLERVTSTPERFLARVIGESPFAWQEPPGAPSGPRDAYLRALGFFAQARAAGGGPATFLLDEALELRLFESFPGLGGAMADTLTAIADSPNRFVLATKYESRALRALRRASDRFLVIHVPPATVPAVASDLMREPGVRSDRAEETARTVVALTDGRAAYVSAMIQALARSAPDAHDPVAVLGRLLRPGGALSARCRYSYEVRLHRARGYGALKAVLGILADEEPLTLTEVALRLQRSPGSTRDYLGWLEDVDLVHVHRKRYTVADPVLRVWIRLYSGCDVPDEDRVADAVQRYAMARLSAGPTTEA
jgi:hypothetical protein